MIFDETKRVFVKPGYVDMRKQINGLSVLVQMERPDGPFDGSYYVFCGRTRRVMKILYWDSTGFCLWLKRLEKDQFPWPLKASEITETTKEKIRGALRGFNLWNEHSPVHYSIAG